MNLFSALTYLLASSACVAASSPTDVYDKHCPEVPNVTKCDVDRCLGFQFGLPILCGATGRPGETCFDLQLYHNGGPADDDRRREALECLLRKLDRDMDDDLRRKWREHVMSRGAPGENVDSDWSESEWSSLTDYTSSRELESLEDFDDTDYGFGDWPPVDAEEWEPADASYLYSASLWVF